MFEVAGHLETAFQKRYGKDVIVKREQIVDGVKIKKVTLKISSPGKRFIMTEHFNNDGNTDYVTLEHNGKAWKYKIYVLAEVHLADLIAGG